MINIRLSGAVSSGCPRCGIPVLCMIIILGLGDAAGDIAPSGQQSPGVARGTPQWTYDGYFNPTQQKAIQAQSDTLVLSLKNRGECQECPSGLFFEFQVRGKALQKTIEFRLENLTAQVDEVHLFGSQRAIIVGRATPNTSVVNVVDLSTGKLIDNVVCLRPSVSPNKHLIAWVRFFPAHSAYWPSFQYMVYDVALAPEDNRVEGVAASNPYDAGIPVYPEVGRGRLKPNILTEDSSTHRMACGGFFWLNGGRFAFADTWRGLSRVVVVDLRGGIYHARSQAKPIDTLDVVDLSLCSDAQPADFRRWSEKPENLIAVEDIEALKDKEGFLRLHFRPGTPCLKRASFDIALKSNLAM